MSNELVSKATMYERNLIRSFTDCMMKNLWRHKMNYLVKGFVSSMFLLELCRANTNLNLYRLKKQSAVSRAEAAPFYRNAAISFGTAVLVLGYI